MQGNASSCVVVVAEAEAAAVMSAAQLLVQLASAVGGPGDEARAYLGRAADDDAEATRAAHAAHRHSTRAL